MEALSPINDLFAAALHDDNRERACTSLDANPLFQDLPGQVKEIGRRLLRREGHDRIGEKVNESRFASWITTLYNRARFDEDPVQLFDICCKVQQVAERLAIARRRDVPAELQTEAELDAKRTRHEVQFERGGGPTLGQYHPPTRGYLGMKQWQMPTSVIGQLPDEIQRRLKERELRLVEIFVQEMQTGPLLAPGTRHLNMLLHELLLGPIRMDEEKRCTVEAGLFATQNLEAIGAHEPLQDRLPFGELRGGFMVHKHPVEGAMAWSPNNMKFLIRDPAAMASGWFLAFEGTRAIVYKFILNPIAPDGVEDIPALPDNEHYADVKALITP